MKIFFISKSGDSAGLWWMCKREGAHVLVFIEDTFARKIMDGFVEKAESVKDGLKNKPDVIVIDMTGFGKLGDDLRKEGYRVVFGGELADKLEFDRSYGAKLAKQFGMKVPKTTEFKNVDDAILFVKKNNKAYAVKMDSNAGGESASYVSKDATDMIEYLQQQKESGKINGNTFVAQEVIKGAEVSTEVWFSNGEPCYPANSTWETKKLLAGELGVRTGCETSLVCHYTDRSSKLAERTVLKIAPLLKYARYTGACDVNAIVSEEDHEPYFLEFTPRLGYSAIYGYCGILGIPVHEYFRRLLGGSFHIPFKNTWGTSLKVHIPPYPFSHEDDRISREAYKPTEGIRIKADSKDFIPIDVKKGKKDGLEAAGTMGIVGECLGRGESIMSAWKGSQNVFQSVEVPNKGGRLTDGVEDAWKRVMNLKKWGYDIPSPSQGQSISAKADSVSPNPKSKDNPLTFGVGKGA